jgi:hypothetical protein
VADGGATALSDNFTFSTVFIGLGVINLLTIPVLFALFRKAPELQTVTVDDID